MEMLRRLLSVWSRTHFQRERSSNMSSWGFTSQISLLSPSLARRDFTAYFYGEIYTINMAIKINPDDATTQIFFFL